MRQGQPLKRAPVTFSIPAQAQLGGTQGSVPNVGTQVAVTSGASPHVISQAAQHALAAYAQASGSGAKTAPALVSIGGNTMPAAQAASLPSSAFMGTPGGGLRLNPNYNPNASYGPQSMTNVGGEMVPIKGYAARVATPAPTTKTAPVAPFAIPKGQTYVGGTQQQYKIAASLSGPPSSYSIQNGYWVNAQGQDVAKVNPAGFLGSGPNASNMLPL